MSVRTYTTSENMFKRPLEAIILIALGGCVAPSITGETSWQFAINAEKNSEATTCGRTRRVNTVGKKQEKQSTDTT